MKLPFEECDLLFDLMWSLQFYVGRKLGLLPKGATREVFLTLTPDDRFMVREALWDDSDQIDAYVRANPDHLDKTKLAIVAGWKQHVRETFFVERLLKDHAIFIGPNDTVYGVKALYEGFDEILVVPAIVQAVLLPFKGQITYDGMLFSPPTTVFFGGNVKRSLKETYMAAKRTGSLIVSLDPAVQAKAAATMQIKLKDWGPQLEALAQEAGALRAQTGSPPTWGAAFSLVKASLALAQAAAQLQADGDQLWSQFDGVVKALNRMETAIFDLR